MQTMEEFNIEWDLILDGHIGFPWGDATKFKIASELKDLINKAESYGLLECPPEGYFYFVYVRCTGQVLSANYYLKRIEKEIDDVTEENL